MTAVLILDAHLAKEEMSPACSHFGAATSCLCFSTACFCLGLRLCLGCGSSGLGCGSLLCRKGRPHRPGQANMGR